MNKFITVATGLLLSSSVLASDVTLHQGTEVSTASYNTRQEAINAGHDMAENLDAMTQNELRFQLPVNSYQNVKNISIDNSKVQVEEFAQVRGEVKYRAVVNVNYHFDAKESN